MPSQTRKTVGRNTASAAIIAIEKNGSPSSTAIDRCSTIISTSRVFFTRLLNSVKGKATCTITVPYVMIRTINPLLTTRSPNAGQGAK